MQAIERINLPKPDTHCFDDDTKSDVWSYSRELVISTVLAHIDKLEAEVERLRAAQATAPAQPARRPMTDADIEAAARRSGATAYTNRFVNGSAFSFGPEALREFVRAVESFKGTP